MATLLAIFLSMPSSRSTGPSSAADQAELICYFSSRSVETALRVGQLGGAFHLIDYDLRHVSDIQNSTYGTTCLLCTGSIVQICGPGVKLLIAPIIG